MKRATDYFDPKNGQEVDQKWAKNGHKNENNYLEN